MIEVCLIGADKLHSQLTQHVRGEYNKEFGSRWSGIYRVDVKQVELRKIFKYAITMQNVIIKIKRKVNLKFCSVVYILFESL